MTSQHSRRIKIRALGSYALFVAVLTVLLVLLSPARQSLALSVTGEGVTVLSTDNSTPATGYPAFLPAVTYPIRGGNSSAVAVADVDGDGKPDLITVSGLGGPNGDGLVDVLLGNGDGTFKSGSTFDSGGGFPESVVVADLNHDGKPDLVVANCGTFIGGGYCSSGSRGVVSVFLGKGDGTFQSATTYDAGGYSAVQVAVADVNLDGKLDLLVAVGEGVTVLLGNGDGTFQAASAPWGESATSIAVADVNSDGRPDLLVLPGESDNLEAVMNVFLGNGDGSFQPPVSYRVPGVLSALGLAVADINQDSKLDVVAVGVGENGNLPGKVGVLLGNGDGTFTQGGTYGTGGRFVFSVAIADVNGDGIPDVVVGNCTSTCVSEDGSVAVLVGTRYGFRSAALYDSGLTSARYVAAVDLNGDGKPDLVAGHYFTNSVSVLLNQTVPFGYPTSTSLTSSLNPSTYGQSVTWTATVAISGSVPPTGKVKFARGTYSIGTAALNASGVAALTKPNLNAGTSPLTAVYTGDENNLSSTSSVVDQVITETTSSATLSSSLNPSTAGQAVTFTATITSPTVAATGPVTFTSGKTVLGTAQLSKGKASFTTSTLAVGSTIVTATYYGDSNIAKSSASVKQTVH